MPGRYLLSVCVPTLNRHDFLELCLERLVSQIGDRGDVEVIVVDNASTDNTRQLLDWYEKSYQYFRSFTRIKTVDGSLQYADTLSRASGDWAVYLADDDWLDLNIVLEHIQSSSTVSHSVSAIYCDWYAWNDKTGKELHRYFKIGETRIFEPSDHLELLNFVLQKRVLPEIGIYRVSLMREAFINGVLTGDFYQNLLGLHRSGTVMFRDPPFYRENRIVKPHLKRTSWQNMGEDLGNQQFELLRSQMERLSMALLSESNLDAENVAKISRLINLFLMGRMLVWRKRALERHNWNKALELDARIRLAQPTHALPKEDSGSDLGLKSLTLLAGLQNLIKALTTRSVSVLAVSEALSQSILDCINKEISIQDSPLLVKITRWDEYKSGAGEKTAYLAISDEEHAALINNGVAPSELVNLDRLLITANVSLKLQAI